MMRLKKKLENREEIIIFFRINQYVYKRNASIEANSIPKKEKKSLFVH